MYKRPKSVRGTVALVAAIDFGTTYSGCAYSFREEYEKNPLNILVNEKWSGSDDASSVPTSVLLNEDKEFEAFGNQAEDKYSKLALKNEHFKWYLFKRFKMTLHNNKDLARNTVIEDENGRKMRAVIIFSMAIEYIKDQLLNNLKRNGHDIKDIDVHWVITVPAIWTEAAKQFMQEAAEQAGIPPVRLTLALEPEAAAVFCKELTTHHKQKEDRALLKAFNPGSRYLVLDLGGGTVDVTIQEVLKPDANLKVLDKASGGAWGGVTVDQYFLYFIKKLVGIDLYMEFAEQFPYQKMEFEKQLEMCKRKATPDTENDLLVTLPRKLIDMYESKNKRKFDNSIVRQTQYSGDISVIQTTDVIEIKSRRVHDFYDKTIQNIIQHVTEILSSETAKGVSSILLVGGFAESSLVEHRITKEFKDKRVERVIVPREAGLAVAKGAVIYGHNPNIIAERVSPYTYGVETRRPFNPKLHPGYRKIKNKQGKDVVDKVFDKHIEVGEIMSIGIAKKEHIFYSINPSIDRSFWNVYRSEQRYPTFCDEVGCEKIGKVEIEMEGLDLKEKRELGFRMTCKGTVLEAEAIDKKTGNHLAIEFDFLGLR